MQESSTAAVTEIMLVIHERRGYWAKQLRPRVHSIPLKVRETRSAPDLEAALQSFNPAILVLDLAESPDEMLIALQKCHRLLENVLVLVLNPHQILGTAGLASELGVTLVYSGFVSPPTVTQLLEHWARLSTIRGSLGWFHVSEPPNQTEFFRPL